MSSKATVIPVADFITKVKGDAYKTGQAARQALGRFSYFSDDDKARARKSIDAKFGPPPSGKSAPKVAAKAPAKKAAKAPAKKAAAPVKAAAKKPAKAAAKTAAKKAPAKKADTKAMAATLLWESPADGSSITALSQAMFNASTAIQSLCAMHVDLSTPPKKETLASLEEVIQSASILIQDELRSVTLAKAAQAPSPVTTLPPQPPGEVITQYTNSHAPLES